MCKRFYNIKKAKKIDRVIAQIIGARQNGKCGGFGNTAEMEENENE